MMTSLIGINQTLLNITSRPPHVILWTIAFPADKVLGSATTDSLIQQSLNQILLIIWHNWRWVIDCSTHMRWELRVLVPGLQEADMEDRVNLEELGKLQLVGNRTDDFLHGEGSKVFSCKLLAHGGW